jgi:hypothetical protein
MKRKTIIAFLFATIMVIARFSGLFFYSSQVAENSHAKAYSLDHYIAKYNFREARSESHNIAFNGPRPATSNSNTVANNMTDMAYTFYNGNNNITGELLHIYVKGKLEHESLIVNNTNSKLYNYTVIPLYSRSGNYHIFNINRHTLKTAPRTIKTVGNGSKIVPEYSYSQCHTHYSTGLLGWFLSFNNVATHKLVADMTTAEILTGFLSFILAIFFLVPGFIAFLAATILAIGAYEISNLNDAGGLHGVYFDGHYMQLKNYGTPWTHPVPWWA